MDIVERLRRTELHHVWDDLEGKMVGKMFSANPDGPEAADEIERLRVLVREAFDEGFDEGKNGGWIVGPNLPWNKSYARVKLARAALARAALKGGE